MLKKSEITHLCIISASRNSRFEHKKKKTQNVVYSAFTLGALMWK